MLWRVYAKSMFYLCKIRIDTTEPTSKTGSLNQVLGVGVHLETTKYFLSQQWWECWTLRILLGYVCLIFSCF